MQRPHSDLDALPARKDIGSDLGHDSIFLGWAPTSNELLVKVNVISNPRVYVVNVAGGKTEQLPVPWTTYNVALSRNGKRMLYSLTRGLGYGSETWLADVDGRNARRILADPAHRSHVVEARRNAKCKKSQAIKGIIPDKPYPAGLMSSGW